MVASIQRLCSKNQDFLQSDFNKLDKFLMFLTGVNLNSILQILKLRLNFII
jgi:hypothetical protein